MIKGIGIDIINIKIFNSNLAKSHEKKYAIAVVIVE